MQRFPQSMLFEQHPVITRRVETANVDGMQVVSSANLEVPNALSALATASTDELLSELARRGRPMVAGPAPVPVGRVLEEVERARRAIGTCDYPDFAIGETLEVLELPSPEQAQLYLDEAMASGEVSWSALLTRELVDALAADPNTRRQRLVGLAAMATRWSEALDARPTDEEMLELEVRMD